MSFPFCILDPSSGRSARSTIVIVMYCVGAFLMGAGYAPYWSLGLVYIDNNVKALHGASKYIGKKQGLWMGL